jgi:uncharacterized membrane protein
MVCGSLTNQGNKMNNAAILLEMKKVKTSHLLHLLLTILTLGCWLLVWILCAAHTSHVNYHLDRKIEKIMRMESGQ